MPYKESGDVGKFLGFVNALVLALFAYMGTELIGVTVGEAKNPRKTVPSAIKKTFVSRLLPISFLARSLDVLIDTMTLMQWRILFFYIIGVLIVGMIVDSKS